MLKYILIYVSLKRVNRDNFVEISELFFSFAM